MGEAVGVRASFDDASGGEGIPFADPREKFAVDLRGVGQDDLVVPPVGGHTLRAEHPRGVELPGKNDIDQDPAAARMDAEERASVRHVK